MKILSTIILLFSLSSCLTEKKVHSWLDDHEYNAAKYCSQKFPVDTISKTEYKYVDSSGYQDAYLRISDYADDLLAKLDSVTNAATPDRPYKPNIDSLRSVINKEVRQRLKPCIDSVVYIKLTVIDHAREVVLQGLIDEKDQLITKEQEANQRLTDKVHDQRKWFYQFWGLVLLIAGYIFLKLRFKFPF